MLVTIRHGQTDLNKLEVFCGRDDSPRLTKESIIATFNKGKELKEYNFDIAFISPLTRAKQTFNELNKSLNIEGIVLDELIERDFKEYDRKSISLISREIYWNIDKDHEYDIEPLKDMVVRIENALNYIRENYHDKNVLIVAHSGVCRVIRHILEGKKENRLYTFKMENLHTDVFKEW